MILLLRDDNPDDRMLALRELKQEFSELQPMEVTEPAGFTQALNENHFDLAITAVISNPLLEGGQLSEEKTAQAHKIIHRNAISQKQLIDDLLDVSRIIRGKLKLDIQAVPLRQVVSAALDTVRHAIEVKQIHLETDFDPTVEIMNGDPERLQQVFWNLLTNATKFTPEGGKITVRIENKPKHIQVQGIDTGQGIEPEQLPHMFERFRQADNSSTRQKSGLGLGLAIVRHLVELHGGTISAESAGNGQDATFTVQLPLLIDIQPFTSPPFNKSRQRHNHLRRNRREYIFKTHQKGNSNVSQAVDSISHSVKHCVGNERSH